jgi:SpoVK/Ycf46/Vps4 family AAA+-type ATPase
MTRKTLAVAISGKKRVDAMAVASKYIGETEKNLSRTFRKAKKTNSVILFDEADSLFGKRTEVKDSHDRYSNK